MTTLLPTLSTLIAQNAATEEATLIRRPSGRLIVAAELRGYKFPVCDLWKVILSLMLACIMGLGVYALKFTPITDLLGLLSTQIMTGIVLYAGLCYIFRISSFMEVIETIKAKFVNLRYAD